MKVTVAEMKLMHSQRRMCVLLMIGLMFLVLPIISRAHAESLWNDSGSTNSLFADHKAHAVGDIITIIISENSSSSRVGSATNSKQATGATTGAGIFAWLAAASPASSDSFTAKGSLTNTNTVTGTITAQVTEVKPNGNLVLVGTQNINQNGETQRINVTGTVRSEDITVDNTIPSSSVANAQIKIDGNGPIANKQKQGILTQIFNFLW